MVAHSTPKTGVEWGTQSLVAGVEKTGHSFPDSPPRVGCSHGRPGQAG
jgi:hypothetical protein